MTELKIGTPVLVGWNGSKLFTGGGPLCGSFYARVEAIGFDWIILRDTNGEARAVTLPSDSWVDLDITIGEED